MRLPVAGVSFAVLASCVSVEVRPAHSGVTAPPREADCAIEFYAVGPGRPYDELAELRVSLPSVTANTGNLPWMAVDELLRKACALGADGFIGSRLLVQGSKSPVLIGSAIRYR